MIIYSSKYSLNKCNKINSLGLGFSTYALVSTGCSGLEYTLVHRILEPDLWALRELHPIGEFNTEL